MSNNFDAKPGDLYGINRHREQDLTTAASRVCRTQISLEDYMREMDWDNLHHDGERQFLSYIYGTIKGYQVAKAVSTQILKQLTFWKRLKIAFGYSTILK
jgi:hypothetical protein